MLTRAAPPVRASSIAPFICMAVLLFSASAHAAGGSAVAWGDNGYGQLGSAPTGPEVCNGSSPCSRTPVPVAGLAGVTQLAGGYEQSLGLLADGTVRAWGNNT